MQAALGRTPSAEEEQPGAGRVALLGDGLWRSRFGADPQVLGRVLTLNGEPYTVIGVLPRTFPFFATGAELVVAALARGGSTPGARGGRPGFSASSAGCARGIPAAPAMAELNPIVARLRAAYPDTNAGKQGVPLEPLADLVVGSSRRTLLVLQGAVALVLLIACTNLANLLLARTAARRPELAMRCRTGCEAAAAARAPRDGETLVLLPLAGGALGRAGRARGHGACCSPWALRTCHAVARWR